MLTDEQIKLMRAVYAGLNHIASADGCARRLRIKRGRLAVSSRLRALERRGLVGRIPAKDQWDHASWFLTDKAKALLGLGWIVEA